MMEKFGDWIEWKGGECPVGADTHVHYRFKDGAEDLGPIGTTDGVRAGNLIWLWTNDFIDIAAYRVVRDHSEVADKIARYEAALREIAETGPVMSVAQTIARNALNAAKGGE